MENRTEEFSLEIFNVSGEMDDIEITLNDDLEAAIDFSGRRC